MWIVEKNKKNDDLYLVIQSWKSSLPSIIDGHRWDGSDFVYNGIEQGLHSPIVTKRVIDWLLNRHAAPFFARPMLVAVDKMTGEQRARLEDVKALSPRK